MTTALTVFLWDTIFTRDPKLAKMEIAQWLFIITFLLALTQDVFVILLIHSLTV